GVPQRSLASWVRTVDGPARVVAVGGLLGLEFVVSLASVMLRQPGAFTSVWWPAAAIAVVAAFAARGRRLLVASGILVTSGLGNFLGGTDPFVSIGFGLCNAVEAWVVATVAIGIGGLPRDVGQRG